MIGNPLRAWRRRRLEQRLRVRVPLLWRPLFDGGPGFWPPPPPLPSVLRAAADTLDSHTPPPAPPSSVITAWQARQTVADWLRELADLLPAGYEFREHFAPPTCACAASELGGNSYRCSLPVGHGGEFHEAQGPNGEVYARWPA